MLQFQGYFTVLSMKKLKVAWMGLLMGSVLQANPPGKYSTGFALDGVVKNFQNDCPTDGRVLRSKVNEYTKDFEDRSHKKYIQKNCTFLLMYPFNAYSEERLSAAIPKQYGAQEKGTIFKGAFQEDLPTLNIALKGLNHLPFEVRVRLILECASKEWPDKEKYCGLFFTVPRDIQKFFKENSFKGHFDVLEDGRVFYSNNKKVPKEILDRIRELRREEAESPLKNWGDFQIAERYLPTEEAYQQILPVYTSLKELQENDVSGKKVTVLHPGDVISSRGLMERGILDEMPKVGYGENLCNQGKEDPVYKLPHVKRNVFLKWADPSVMDSGGYISYHVLKEAGIQCFTWFLECFVEKEQQAQKVGHMKLILGGQKEDQIEIDGVWFDKDVLAHAYYLQKIPGWEKDKGCGLAALNTLLLFFQHNPDLYPWMKSWTLTDLSQVNGQRVLGKIYPKLGFEIKHIEYDEDCDIDPSTERGVYCYCEDRPRFLSLNKEED